jgi:hypothetical protein
LQYLTCRPRNEKPVTAERVYLRGLEGFTGLFGLECGDTQHAI